MLLQFHRPASLAFFLVASLIFQAMPAKTHVAFARTPTLPSSSVQLVTDRTEAASNAMLPTITATMTDAIVPADDGDGKADPAGTEKIQYTATIANSGSDASGVQFNDVLDTHTILVPGSLNAAPLAGDDAFAAIGNTLLVVGNVTGTTGPRKTIAGNVLTNDTEFLGDTFKISACDATGTNGGTVNMVTTGPDAGSFTYISAANFTGTDTFNYTLRDDGIDGVPDNADDLTGVGTVTITVANQVWYVDNGAGAGGDGRSTTPFDALADVSGASGPDTTGDIIFVRTGSGNYTGGIVLLAGQTLWGENSTLVVDTFTLQAAGGDPVITNSNPASDGVTLPANGNNTLKGFTVANTTGYDISSTVTTSVGTLNISNVILNGTGGLFRADSGGVLAVTFDSASTTSASGNGIQLGNTSGSVTISGSGAISGVTGTDVLISGGTVSLSCASSITHATGGAAVSVASHNTGTITFTGNVNASAGTGLQFDNADSTTSYNFNGTNTLSGGDAGVDILNGSAGTFTFSSNTSITNPSGIAFNVSASNPTVTYSGNITTNANRPVSISNAAAAGCGSITLQTGNITANSGSNGILVNNCNAGTVTFSGAAVSLTTTTNAGVTLTNNTGASINFSGGNLDITTTTGKAFTATGGGTVRVSGASNTLTTESDGAPAGGMILEVTDTTIGSGGLNFLSLTGHGGSATTRAVHLKNAGTGGLTVTGTGTTADSGGIITNYVQQGIKIESTNNISLTNMNLAGNGTANLTSPGGPPWCGDDYNGANDANKCAAGIDLQTVNNAALTRVHVSGGVQIGINGNNVTDLVLDTIEVNNVGTEVLEDGIQLVNLITTSPKTWTDLNLHDSASRQLAVQNSSGTNNITINKSASGTLFFGNSAWPGPLVNSNGILWAGHGTANVTLSVQNAVFTRNYGSALHSDIADSASANVTVNGGSMPDNGLIFEGGGAIGTGNFTYTITNLTNTWADPAHTNSSMVGVLKGLNSSGTFVGNISNNQIYNDAIAGSAGPCDGCPTMLFTNGGSTGTHNLTIANNTIRRTQNGILNITSGINVANDASFMNLSITGNNFSTPDDADNDLAITIVNGTDANDTSQTCANISGNTITDPPGGGSWNSSALIRLRHVQNNKQFKLPGYGGGATDTTAVANFLNSQNTLTTPDTAAAISLGPGTFVGGGACFLTLALKDVKADYRSLESVIFGSLATLTEPEPVETPALTQPQLDATARAAISRWIATGLTADQIAAIRGLRFEVADLAQNFLGESGGDHILVDRDAQGMGWFIDATSLEDSEFGIPNFSTPGQLNAPGRAAARIDLVTALNHEIGHKLGLPDSYSESDRDNIMYGYLTAGERRNPAIGQAAGVETGSLNGTHHLKLGLTKKASRQPSVSASIAPPCINDSTQVCVPIGALRTGDTVTITFQVTVNNPPGLSLLNPARVSTQGSVSHNESGSAVLTDDTSVVGPANPTETEVDLFDTATSVLTSGSPSNQGDSVTFTATVAENPAQPSVDPTGTVQFLDGVTPLTCSEGGVNGVRPLAGGSAACTTSAITPAGSPHTINANYSGDGNFDPSSGSVQQTVLACVSNPIVNSTADPGDGVCDGANCTLREAVTNVCNGSTITFNLPGAGPHTITLTAGELQVAKNVTIKNNSGESVTVSGNNASRVFNINSGKTASIIGVSITLGSAASGAGVLNDGTLTVVSSTLTGNNATGDGGAITTSASATSLTLVNTTISGNNAYGNGGGVAVLGGTMTSINSTITNNKADNDNNATGTGGGIAGNSTTIVKNTIVAGNFNEDGASDAADDISGTIDPASSFNLIGTGGFGGLTSGVNNNQVGVADAGLGLLADNGGITFTHALLPTSLAVETGGNVNLPVDTFDLDGDTNLAEALPVDQRGVGYPRNADSADGDAIQTVDIGAYELHPSLQDITDKSQPEDSQLIFSFEIGDATGTLISSVTATSSNTTLVPNNVANLSVSGGGTLRSLTITPVANANSPVDGTTTITVTVTATNGRTATDTFVLTVTEVNDNPVPANDTVPDVGEDCSSGCTGSVYVIPFATLLGNDTDKGAANESGQTLNITAVSLPTGGTVAINGTNVEFTPTADFSGPAGFTYTATDNGATNGALDAKSGNASISFNITAVNDNPVLATNTGITVNEGSSGSVITSGMLSVTDVDNTPAQLTFTVGTAPVNGVLKKSGGALAGGSTFTQADVNTGFITYDHDGSDTTSDSFTFTVSDGAGGSIGLSTFNIAVTPVNDAPVVVTTAGNLGYLENDPATVIDNGVTVTDSDSPNLVGATVSITANFDAGKDVLSWTDNNLGDNITLSGMSTAQTIVLTGTDTPANYQAALRVVKFRNTSDNPSTLTRTVTFTANDGTDAGANTRGIDVTAVNDVPSFTKGANQTVNEDAGAQTVSGWATNISAGPEESGQTVNFIVSNNNNALFSVQPAVDSAGVLTYTPAANAFGTATVDVQIHDNGGNSNGGQDTSAVQQFTITVNAVADTPSVSNTTTLEDTPSSTNLVITRNAADGAEVTHFKITNIQNGTLFKHDGTTQINNGDFILVAEAANVGGFGLVFKPAPDFNSNTGNGSFDIQASIGGSNAGLGGAIITAITITPVNDTPSFTKGPDINVNANSGAHSFPGWATNIARGPATATDETGQTVNFILSNNNNALFSVQPAIDSTGQLTFTVAAAAFGQATVNVQIHDNGGGADTSAIQTFVITVTSVDLTPTKSHVGNFTQSDTGKTYTISVKNIGQDASTGAVTLADTVPAGLIARSLSGAGWTCDPIPGGGTPGPVTLNCTRSDSLAGSGAVYPDITLTVDVSCTAAPSITNSATVSGGNDASPGNNTSNDVTVVNPDSVKPLIVCPGGISKYTDSGQNSAVINIQPAVATDNCGVPTVTGTRSDGKPLNAPFPVGITIITWTAKDAANNITTCAQSITVMVPSSPHRIPGDEPDEDLLTDLLMVLLSAVW